MAPKVDADKCEGCGTCVDVCPASVFEMENDVAVPVRADDCLDCGACAEECPSQAISLEE